MKEKEEHERQQEQRRYKKKIRNEKEFYNYRSSTPGNVELNDGSAAVCACQGARAMLITVIVRWKTAIMAEKTWLRRK